MRAVSSFLTDQPMNFKNSLVFHFPSAYVTHMLLRLAFPIDSIDWNSTYYACVAVTLLTEPASQLQFSTAMQGTALAPNVSVSFLALSWHLCHDLKRQVCGWYGPPGRLASVVMGWNRKPCGLILISLLALVSFPIFYPQPNKSDWQVCCLPLLSLDDMLFLQSHLHLLTYIHF